MSDVLKRLQALPVDAPLDVRQIREDILDEHERATTTEERVRLLGVFEAVMDLVERNLIAATGIDPDVIEKFREARRSDYKLMIVKECLVGENICTETLDAVTLREIAAGRMASDNGLREIATKAMAAPHLSRAELIAMDAKKREGTTSTDAQPVSGWRRIFAWMPRN